VFSVLLLATGFINQVGCNTLPIVTYAVDGETASSTFERLKGEMQAAQQALDWALMKSIGPTGRSKHSYPEGVRSVVEDFCAGVRVSDGNAEAAESVIGCVRVLEAHACSRALGHAEANAGTETIRMHSM